MTQQLLNTLYVQTQGAYLRLDHDTVAVEADGKLALQVPIHHLGGLAVFGNVLISPFLLQKCAEEGRSVAWFSHSGRFHGRLAGPTSGNVLLRCAQHEASRDAARALRLARAFVDGKIRNARTVLLRAARDHGGPELDAAAALMHGLLDAADGATDVEALRGVEGSASAAYFRAFPALVRSGLPEFAFTDRNRRPPRDPVNALLSFGYSLLAQECASAAEGVGLDPQVGFLHALRPGRPALALDLMEEFRALVADRAALTLINRGQLEPRHFQWRDGGAVLLAPEGRRIFLTHWQQRKQELVDHPLLQEPVAIGLLPHIQARLLARALRQDVPSYVAYAPR